MVVIVSGTVEHSVQSPVAGSRAREENVFDFEFDTESFLFVSWTLTKASVRIGNRHALFSVSILDCADVITIVQNTIYQMALNRAKEWK